jgi:hypothetical protein
MLGTLVFQVEIGKREPGTYIRVDSGMAGLYYFMEYFQ